MVLLSLTVAMTPSGVSAQALQAGDRARIVIREAQPQDEDETKGRLILRGEVTRLQADTAFLRVPGATGELGVLLPTAISVHRSRGMRSRPASALRKGFGVAVAGALYFGLTYSSDQDYGVTNRGEAWALGAGLGAVTGALIGALFPTERWQRVRP